MKATILDLRYRMKEVLGAIDRGETVIVLHRGKERAKLIPISLPPGEETSMTKDQSFFGMWRDREDIGDPVSYVRSLRQGRQFTRSSGSKKRSKVDTRNDL